MNWYAQICCLPHASISAGAKAGFGFDEIMRDPDCSRFPTWYTQFSYLAPGRQAAIAAVDRTAGAGRTEAAPCFDLKEAA